MSITGSNNPFACEPVVFANTNAIVSLGTITRDGNEFTFSVGFVWKINGVIYQNTAPVVLTIAEASEGFSRIDNALLNTLNSIELQQGLESETIALKPVAPDTNIILTSWNIFGTTIGDTEDPIIGTSFVKKSFFAPFVSTVTGADAIIPLDPNGYSEIRLTDASLTSIAGFDLSLITGVPTAEVPYNGKPYIIRNLTGNNITIKNELGAADYPFFLSGGGDLVFPNGQAIYVLYDSSGFNEIFKSWSTLDEATDFGNTTTNDIITGKITTPMVRMPKGSFNVHIYPVDLTANRKLEAPDKNGIIATLDDIPSNPITGAGTTNYVSKFIGASTLGNSQIFDNGTNVGIGTTSLSAKLTVEEGITYGFYGPNKSTISAVNTTTDGKAGFIDVVGYSGNSVSLYRWGGISGGKTSGVGDGYYGGFLSLWTTSGGGNAEADSASYERMRITSSGNVGIGTTSVNDSAILHLESEKKGFLPPVMSTPQMNGISSPAEGLMIYNKEERRIFVFDGNSWKALAYA